MMSSFIIFEQERHKYFMKEGLLESAKLKIMHHRGNLEMS